MNKILKTILTTLIALVGVSLPAAASYFPFNTNVNMNIGIGTSTPQGAFVVTNGNVGIGTWSPTNLLSIGANAFGINSNGVVSPLGGQASAVLSNSILNLFNNNVSVIENSFGSPGDGIKIIGGSNPNSVLILQSSGSIGNGDSIALKFGNLGVGTTTVEMINGNVGIGSLAPGAALDVNGTVRMTGFTLSQNPSAGYVLVGNGVGVGTWMPANTLGTAAGTNYWLLNGGAGNVGINTSYAVGIGTSFVGGTGEAALSVMNGNVGIGTWLPNGGLVVMNGNLGIGTANPSYSIDTSAESGSLGVQNIYGPLSNSLSFVAAGLSTQNGPSYIFQPYNGYTGLDNSYSAQGVVKINGIFAPSHAGDTGGSYSLEINPIINAVGSTGTGTFRSLWVNETDTVSGAYIIRYLMDLQTGGVSQMSVTDNGNVGIGTSTPQGALVVTNGNVGIGTWVPGLALDVNGTVRMTGLTLTGNGAANGYVLVGNGVGVGTWMPASSLATSAGSNYWSLIGGAGNVGIGTTNTVGIGTSSGVGAGLVVMNGNVGIGTWKPASLLDVGNATAGDVQIDSVGDLTASQNIGAGGYLSSAFDVIAGTADNAGSVWFGASQSGVGISGSDISNIMTLSTSDIVRINIDAAGNVGIGTISSVSKLNINGGVGIGTSLTNGAYLNFNAAPSGGLIVQNNVGIGTFNPFGGKLIVTGGNVGIGSLAPGAALDVNGTVRMTGLTLTGNGAASGNVLVTNAVGMGTWMPANTLGTAAGTNYWLNDTTGNVGISTIYAVGIGTAFVGGTGEAALSVMNGNVGIGTWVPAYPLDVRGPDGGNWMQVGNPGTSAGLLFAAYTGADEGAQIEFKRGDGNVEFQIQGDNGAQVATYFNSALAMNFDGGGNVGINLNAITSSSNLGVNGSVGIGSTTYYNTYSAPPNGMIVQGNVGIGTFNPFGGQLIVPITNGNVGIGSLTPGQALDVQGTVRTIGFTMSGQTPVSGYVLTASDSNGDATWSPSSSVGTNYWLNDLTGNVGISTTYAVGIGTAFVGGTGEAALSVMNGNVGIGTWVPSSELFVNNGVITSFSALSSSGEGIVTYAGNGKAINMQAGTANGNILYDNTGGLSFQSEGRVQVLAGTSSSANITMNIDVNGNVGIGTIGVLFGGLIVQNGNVGLGTFFPQTGLAVMNGNVGIGTWTAKGGNLIVNGGGNVGIGSAWPGQLLDVQGTVRTIGFTMSGQTPVSGYVLTASDSSGDATWTSPGVAGGWTVSGNNVYETSGGNVGIGTTLLTTAALTVMNGNVGIGTWVPAKLFSVTGDTYLNGNLGIGTTFVGGTGEMALTVMNGNVGIGTWVANKAFQVGNSTSGYYNVDASGDTQQTGSWTLNTNYGAKLNMATAGPGAIFHITGNFPVAQFFQDVASSTTPVLTVQGGATPSTGANLQQWQNSSGALLDVVTSAGNVGIGTSNPFGGGLIVLPVNTGNVGIGSLTPGQALDVQGTVRTIGFTMSGQTPVSGYVLTASDSSGDATWTSPGVAGGWTVSGNNVYETSGGNVGIGTTLLTTSALTVMNGNVGIGTWVPASLLDVEGGNILLSNNNGISFRTVAGAITATNVFGYSSGNAIILNQPLNGQGNPISIRVASNPVLQIQPTGSASNLANIGIGTFSPEAALDIVGNVGIGTGINSPYVTTTPPSGGMIIQGNVGIGSLTPGQILDVNGTARMTGFTLTGNGAASGNVMVSNGIGVGTWMSTLTLPIATVTAETPGDVTYYSTPTGFAGGTGFQTNGTNVGIGTSNFTNASLQVVGNIGIGTVKNGDNFINTLPPDGGMIVEGNVGIGTWVPNFPLSVTAPASAGDETIAEFSADISAGSSAHLYINNTAGASNMSGELNFASNGSNKWGIGNDWFGNGGENFFINDFVANAVRMFINPSGNVGIGSLAPGQLLDVQGTVRTIGLTMSGQTPISGYVLTSQDSSGDATWSSPGAVGGWTVSGNNVYETSGGNVGIGTTLLTTAALTVMNGNVGIGTWIPKEALDVEGTFSIAFFNGNVGIGTYGSIGASPGSGLNILQGNANTNVGDNFENTNSTGYEGINLYDNTGTLAASFQYGNATATVPSLIIGNREAGNMNIAMGAAATTRDIFTNGGNLGIGTQTSNQLDVNGGVSIGTAYNAYTQTTAPAGGLIVSGNVGIGSLAPGQAMDVQGTIRALGENVNGSVGIGTYFGNSALAVMDGDVGIGTWNPSAALSIKNIGLPYFHVTNTSSGDIFNITNAGNVGIGSTAPGQLLDVQGTVRDLGELVNGNVGIGTSFVNGAGEGALTVMNGNVGIGTWVPAYNLDLVNNTARERNVRRVNTVASSATPAINTDTTDLFTITALAANITSFTTNLTGTPNNGDLLEIRILDNGTARTIAWGASFGSTTTTLPATTVVNTTLRILLEYDSVQAKWECIGVT
jgi:hypothetical protein